MLRTLAEQRAAQFLDHQLQGDDLRFGVRRLRLGVRGPRLGLGDLRLGLAGLGFRRRQREHPT